MTLALSDGPTVITVGIHKGGVGKTSLISNLGGILAQLGHSVLIVVTDPQDNTGEDLGYTYQQTSDDGANLAAALLGREPLTPLQEVRERLDVVTAGHHLEQFLQPGGPTLAPDALRQALLTVDEDYDYVLIDTPPSKGAMTVQAMTAASWLLVPTKADASSKKGIAGLGAAVREARSLNPELQALGVVLFGVASNATRVSAQTRADLQARMQGVAPVFEHAIRYSEAVAFDCRELGYLAHELEAYRSKNWRNHVGKGRQQIANAHNVAADYEAVVKEMLDNLTAAEHAALTEG